LCSDHGLAIWQEVGWKEDDLVIRRIREDMQEDQ